MGDTLFIIYEHEENGRRVGMRGKGHRGFGLTPSARERLRTPEWQREERKEGRRARREEKEKEKKEEKRTADGLGNAKRTKGNK